MPRGSCGERHAAYLTLIGQVADVRFDRGMSTGESACEMLIQFRQRRGKPNEPHPE
jgi:hypothetical protein